MKATRETMKIGRLTVHIQGQAGDYIYGETASRKYVIVRQSTMTIERDKLVKPTASRMATLWAADEDEHPADDTETSECPECMDTGMVLDDNGLYSHLCDCEAGEKKLREEEDRWLDRQP